MTEITLQLYRLPDVKKAVGIGATKLYELIAQGTFVPPVKLGHRISLWPRHEVDAVVAAIIAGYSKHQLRDLVKSLVAARKGAISPPAT